MILRTIFLVLCGIVSAGIGTAAAQCLTWDPGFDVPGVNGTVNSFAVYDDGRGPALYVGGNFEEVDGIAARSLARWDGSHWERVGAQVPDYYVFYALCVFDDGSGPALYAAGDFSTAGGLPAQSIARWDGTTWSAMGAGFDTPVSALAVYDDGTGPALYAGGPMMSGSTFLGGLAKWNGTTWLPVGGGMTSGVTSLAVYDPGTGPRLYIGGYFATVGSSPAGHIASWDGTSLSPLAGGLDGYVNAVTVHNNRLYAGGVFTHSGTTQMLHVAAWNGTSWSSVGNGIDACSALASVDLGTGARLFAGGYFPSGSTQPYHNIAMWDGVAWNALGAGTDQGVGALIGYDAGAGTQLHVGGAFKIAGGVGRTGIAAWRNGWSSVIETAGQGPDRGIKTLATVDLGNGPKLYAGGSFSVCGSTPAQRIARWNGTTWSALGGGLGSDYAHHVDAIAAYDHGSGPELYAAGDFTPDYIKRWNGTNWVPVGLGIGYAVTSLVAHDDGSGPALFAGGYFTTADMQPALRVAKWNGSHWSPLGSGMNQGVRALAVYDDGGGSALYAGGIFSTPAVALAKWNGSTWSAVGSGINGTVSSLVVHDDGNGPALYAAGSFNMVGGVPANHVARWNGTWSAVGSGLAGPVLSLASFDDGNGTALYAGDFTSQTGGVAHIWRWNGSIWTQISYGMSGAFGAGGGVGVEAMAVVDDATGGGPDLFVAGTFSYADQIPAAGLARWHGCSVPFTTFCSGDGSGTSCPCGNAGLPGNGCANNSQPNGAHLAASGTASISADTLILTATGVTNGSGLYFQGASQVSGGQGAVFGDGLRCVGGQVVRLGIIPGSGNSSHYPRIGIDQPVSTRGLNIAGSVRNYQLWYRETASFCSPATFNLTNGVNLTWLP
jgi:hypothetical protein